MKIKYFMRGLGIGILFTAIVFFLADRFTGQSGQMTDQAIIERAKQLGMVEKEIISEQKSEEVANNNVSEETEDIPVSNDRTEAEQTQTTEVLTTEEPPAENTEETATEETAAENSGSDEEESNDTDEETDPADEETITFTVRSGASSDSISRKLKQAGMIEDANEFDNYLISNGYSGRIRVGTYELKKGMTFEEIARIISSR